MLHSERFRQHNSLGEVDRAQQELVLRGRSEQLKAISEAIDSDTDLVVAGPPGSGRHFIVGLAVEKAQQKSKSVEVDCLGATSRADFTELLCSAINHSFEEELGALPLKDSLQDWLLSQSQTNLYIKESGQLCIRFKQDSCQNYIDSEWRNLLQVLKKIAQAHNLRVLLIFRNFTHIRTWEKEEIWELALRQEVKDIEEILYILIGTIGELQEDQYRLKDHLLKDREKGTKSEAVKQLRERLCTSYKSIRLGPLADSDLEEFIDAKLTAAHMRLSSLNSVREHFLKLVDGSLGCAVMLLERIMEIYENEDKEDQIKEIMKSELNKAIGSLLKEQADVYETILLMLPPRQAKLLMCLALDPTDKPHSRNYIQKHHLDKGGTTQGALLGLQKKGLIHHQESQVYKLTLPLLNLWIHQRSGHERGESKLL